MNEAVRSLDFKMLLMAFSPMAWWVPVLVRRRHWSLRDDLAVRMPALRTAAVWLAAYAVYFAAGEYLDRRFGLTTAPSWIGRYDTAAIVVRAVAIVLVAPLSEEIFFRGVLFRLLRGRLRPGHQFRGIGGDLHDERGDNRHFNFPSRVRALARDR